MRIGGRRKKGGKRKKEGYEEEEGERSIRKKSEKREIIRLKMNRKVGRGGERERERERAGVESKRGHLRLPVAAGE